jgi:hypothetical protein
MLKQAELFEYLKKEATDEAQQFADQANFEPDKIAQKIADERKLIIQLSDSISMKPGTSSRYWIDCYIAALENTLESLKVTT